MAGTEYPGVNERSITDILGETISVLSYGAVGDGVTDDAPAFTTAIARLVALNGRRLYIPGGRTYLLSTPVEFPSGSLNITLAGDGPSTRLKRGANMPSNKGVFELVGSKYVGFKDFEFDGDVTTSTQLNYTAFSGDPMHSTLLGNTSFWFKAGCTNILFDNVTIQHTGGYSVLLDARAGNISDIYLLNCKFKNNRPHLFGTTTGDLNYGSWTGGIHYQGDGTNYAVENLYVQGCLFSRNTGNCVWGHMYALNKLHRNINVVDSWFWDCGLDAILVGGVMGGSVANNKFRRIGYVTTTDSDTPVPKYLANKYAVGIDTAGLVRGVNYTGNTLVSVNGGCIDLDGYSEGTVSGNTCIMPESGQPEYTEDSIAISGPTASGTNWTYGAQVSNSNNDSIAGTSTTVCDNTFKNMGGGAVRMYASRSGVVRGNSIFHPANANVAPIILGNIGTGTNQRAYNNVVTENTIWYSPISPVAAVQEDDQYGAFDPSDVNHVSGNKLIGTNVFEFFKDSLTASTTKSTLSSAKAGLTAASETIVQREDLYTRWYTKIGGTQTSVMTMLDQVTLSGGVLGGTLLNVSRGVGVGGVFSTGGRTSSAFDDAVVTGKLFGDSFIALGDATYDDADADLMGSGVWLLRYNTTLHRPEHSTSVLSGARVWEPLVATAAAGVDGNVQFNTSSALDANPLFTFNDVDVYLGVGTSLPRGGVEAASSEWWSSYNFGASLIASGTRNNAVAIVNSDESTIFAIAAVGTNLQFAEMPAFGDTTTVPVTRLCITKNVGVGVNLGPVGSAGSALHVSGDTWLVGSNAAKIQLLIAGAASQTANLTEWRNSGGTALCAVDASGNFYAPAYAARTDSVSPSSTVESKLGARELRFRQASGDESNAGTIAYRTLSSNLDIIGSGTTSSNRIVKVYDYLVVSGVASQASLQLSAGYVSSPDGYSSVSTSYQAVNIPSGGVFSRSVHVDKYVHIAGNSGVPTATAGTSVPANGMFYYDTTLTKFRAYENGAWKDMISAATSAAGSSGQVQFNNSGSFGADSNLHWDNTQKALRIGSALVSDAKFQAEGPNYIGGGTTDFLCVYRAGENQLALQTILDGYTLTSYISSPYGGTQNRIYLQPVVGCVIVGNTQYGATFDVTGNAYLVNNAASSVALLVRGAASQTGNLQEWQSSAGTTLSAVDPSGSFYAPAYAARTDSTSPSSTTEGKLGAREIRFRQASGDETNAGSITYKTLTSNLDIVGAGTTTSNRIVKVYDYLIVSGVSAQASLQLSAGYVSAPDGFYSTSTSYQAVNIPSGGLFGRSVHADKYIHIAGNSGVPTATSGTSVPSNGMIYYDTSLTKFRAYENGSWKDVISAGTSAAGSTGQIQFNASGVFAADSNLHWDNTQKALRIGAYLETDAQLQVDGPTYIGGAGNDFLCIYRSADNALAMQTLLDGRSLADYTSAVYGGTQNRIYLQPLIGSVIVGNTQYGATIDVTGNLWVVNSVAASVAMLVKGAASQIGNLFEWHNSAGTVLGAIDPSGNVYAPAYAARTDTATSSSTDGKLAARQIRFRQNASSEETNSGVIDFRHLVSNSLSIIGAGSSTSNRIVSVYDYLVVNGVSAQASLQITNGYVASAEGYSTTSTAYNCFNGSSGGVNVRSAHIDKYIHIVGNNGVPTATSGASVPSNGMIYYDTGLAKFRAYENSSWKDLITAAGSVSSVNSLTGALTIAGTTNEINVSTGGSTITIGLPDQIVIAGFSSSSAGITISSGYIDAANGFYSSVSSDEALKLIYGGVTARSINIYNSGGGGAYTNVINSSGAFVGNGVAVQGNGVGGGAFNVWNGISSYYSGQTQTSMQIITDVRDNAGTTEKKTRTLDIRGGVVTSISAESGWTPI